VKILAVSDEVVERLYNLCNSGHFNDVKLILGCGDLPYTYLENIVTLLNVPLLYVPGNHDPEYDSKNVNTRAEGGLHLDLKLIRHKDILIGGFGGSIRYRPDGSNQYSQSEANWRARRLLPGLAWNRVVFGRALDILITHSPAFGIHDDESQSHQGLKAINWLLRTAKPRYHFHGHVHFQRGNLAPSETVLGPTKIMNVYPYKVIDITD
jgi:Icc-related predicted phosphoesterase